MAQSGHETGSEEPGRRPGPQRRKRRHWGRRIALLLVVVVVMLLIAVVAGLPLLLSTETGRSAVESMANRSMDGRVEIGGLSLAWGEPSTVEGVRVWDEQGRPVATVAEARVERGLWDLIWSPEKVGSVRVAGVDARVYMEEKEEEEPFEVPEWLRELELDARLEDVRVVLVDAQGRELAVEEISGQVTAATLNDVQAAVTGRVSSGWLEVEADVKDLWSGEEIDPAGARGTVALTSTEPIALEPLGAFLLEDGDLAGRVRVDVKAQGTAGSWRASLLTQLEEVVAPIAGGRELRPINATVRAQVSQEGEQWQGELTGQSEVGEVSASGHFGGGAWPDDGEEVVAALATGRELELPEFSVTGQGQVDLARLAEAVPGLLELRQDVEVLSGRVVLTGFEASGGARPALQGRLEAAGLRVRQGEREIDYEPVEVETALRQVLGEGLVVDALALRSAPVTLQVSGSVQSLSGQIQGDLGALRERVAEVVEIGEMELAGRLAGDFRFTREMGEDVAGRWDLNVEGLRYGQGERRVAIETLTSSGQGVLTVVESQLERVELYDAQVAVNGREMVVQASGWYAPAEEHVQADVYVPELDIAAVAGHVERWTGEPAEPWSGRAQASATVSRRRGADAFEGQGRLVLAGLDRGEQVVLGEGDQLEAVVNGARWRQGSERVTVERAVLEGLDTRAELTELRLAWDEPGELECEASVEGELGRWRQVLAALSEKEDMPALAGRVRWSGRAATTGPRWEVAGDGEVTGLAVGEGEQAFEEERVAFTHTAVLNRELGELELEGMEVQSEVLRAQLSGMVEDIERSQVMDLTGVYEADWGRLTRLIHQLAPETAGNLAWQGKSGGPIRVEGPLHTAGARPSFVGLNVRSEFGWEGAQMYGLDAQDAEVELRLADGVLRIGPQEVEANGGTMQVVAVVDWTQEPAVAQVTEQVNLLDAVSIDAEMGDELLSRINPVFGQVLGLQGLATLGIEGLSVPVEGPGLEGAQGRGWLEFDGLEMEPAGLLGELVGLLGGGQGWQQSRTRRLDFVIEDGWVRYDQFALRIGNLPEMEFDGAVGLMGGMDLAVSVPVTAGLLERLDVRGVEGQVLGALRGMRVRVPIRGTRQEPFLDFSGVEMGSLLGGIEGVLEGIARPERRERPIEPGVEEEPQEPQRERERTDEERAWEIGRGIADELLRGILERQGSGRLKPNEQGAGGGQ